MKIGIITIHKVENYGAELQAYALYKTLKNQGYYPEIIDYLYVKHPQHIEEKRSKPWTKLSFKDQLKWQIIKLIRKLIPYYKNSMFRRRRQNFDQFSKNMTFSKTFRNISSLEQNQMDYDVYVTGSDQVWNPATMSSLDPYFLSFVPKNAKKISYASSFGVSKLPEYLKPRYRTGLLNFTFLSCRESDGVELIHEISGKKAEHVLDPTLLLSRDDWKVAENPYREGIFEEGIKNKYIFIYALEESETINDLALKIKTETGWDIIKIYKNHFAKGNPNIDQNIYDAGPSEFVYLIDNASFILTNSFHGTAFAINFEIPFYTIYSTQKANNSRQIGLLEKMNLSERLISDTTDLAKFYPNLQCSFIHSRESLIKEKNNYQNQHDQSRRETTRRGFSAYSQIIHCFYFAYRGIYAAQC